MKKEQEYLKGRENWLIRMYFYLNSGLTIINNFRNLIMGIFALYFLLKLTNPIWLVVMLLASLPVLVVVGYYNVHRMAKINEWLSMKFSTHYGIKQFTYVEEQVQLLKDIKNKLNGNTKSGGARHTKRVLPKRPKKDNKR